MVGLYSVPCSKFRNISEVLPKFFQKTNEQAISLVIDVVCN